MILLLKNLFFTLLVPGTVAVYVPLEIAGDREIGPTALVALAVALFGVGGAIYAWCVFDFAAFGRGTPAPIDAPKKLVVRGLYRYSRNPMYVGVLTVILGWAALYASLAIAAYAVVVFAAFHLFVRSYEEPHLERAFPTDYAEYRARVGRWWPRVGAPR